MKGNLLLKIFSLATAGLLVAPGLYARDKLDLGSRARLRADKQSVAVARSTDGTHRLVRKAPAQSIVVRAFITLAPGHSAEELADAGATVKGGRGKLVLAEFPAELLPEIEALEAVEAIRTERRVDGRMNLVREATGIDAIHAGSDLPQAYDGTGVIAGIVDGGFDPNHLNFKNEDGTSRIQHFTYYRPTQSGEYVEEKYGADYIPQIDTEDDETYHGTHTLGIMAGSYKGDVKYAVKKNAFQTSIEEGPNPYYGIATGADLAVSCGAGTDYYVALGIESILNYAYDDETGVATPAVVNLSLGTNIGPHDGTSTLCQYLDMTSERDRVIFCLAAGNEGDMPIALTKTFGADDTSVSTFLFPNSQVPGYQNLLYGQTYVYSDSKTQFDIQALVMNKSRGVAAARLPMAATSGGMMYWISDEGYRESDTDQLNPQLAQRFTGYIGIGAEFDENSGRYYALLDYMLWDNAEGNPNGDYVIGIQVDGSEGQRVDYYCDGLFNSFTSFGIEGASDGSSDGSISDLATGKNYVVVGSYNTRDDWASLDGGVYGYDMFKDGQISSFSSYGSLVDGRTMPTVCAPGATVISSSNQYYLEEYGVGDNEIQAKVAGDDRTYSWHYAIGTSMATPVVSGSIALWLQADPTLTYADVLDIIKTTAKKDEAVSGSASPAQWGAGKFDAYLGLKEVLLRQGAGVGTVAADSHKTLVSNPTGRNIELFRAGAAEISASVFNISGICMASVRAAGENAEINVASLPAGVYILNIEGEGARRVIIR